jgi:hypothetical protein
MFEQDCGPGLSPDWIPLSSMVWRGAPGMALNSPPIRHHAGNWSGAVK